VIISGDSRSNRPQVSDAYRSRGATVLNTPQRDAVTVTVASESLYVSSWRTGASRQSAPPWGDLSDAEDEPAPVPN
jgi:hypothetical protein